MKIKKNIQGFTLIELMIVLGIVGVLASLAYSTYVDSIRKSNRSTAQVELMDAAQRLQRCYTAFASFTNPACTVFTDLSSSAGITSRGAGHYRIDFAIAPTVATYTLRATAILAPQLEDAGCTVMTLTSTGVRTPAQNTPVADPCWK